MAVKMSLSGIVGWDITALGVERQLDAAAGKDIIVDIASAGGLVFEGLKIFNLLDEYSGKVTMRMVGLVASMASYIALAADEIEVKPNAVYMIHNARAPVYGDQNKMRATAKYLEGLSNIMAKEYVRKSGKQASAVKKLMDKETFFYGNEIVENGFGDKLLGKEDSGSKDSSLGNARALFNDAVAKFQDSNDYYEDLESAAALFSVPDNASASAVEPVGAENIVPNGVEPENVVNHEEETMVKNLAEAIAGNSAIKAEVEALKTEQYNLGVNAAKTDHDKVMAKVMPVIEGDAYPNAVKALAARVLKGESDVSAVEAVIAMCDAETEKAKSTQAKKETGEQDETPAQDDTKQPKASKDGIVENEGNYAAELAAAKAELGLEG